MGLMDNLEKRAKLMNKKIVLAESEDERVLKAAAKIIQKKLAGVILVGNEERIKTDAKNLNVNISEAEIINPKKYTKTAEFAEQFFIKREKKGMTLEKATEIMENDPRYFGAMLVENEIGDAMVAGSMSPTADVLRAAIHVIGPKKGLKTVSSCFIMITKTKELGDDGVFIFSDCGAIPSPTPEQMADIAISSVEKARKTVGMKEPKVAFLSFSTKGSAKDPSIDKVIASMEALGKRDIDFDFDGELQLDAAIVPAVAMSKAPGSKIEGMANILLFPDLNAGNIGYKLVERFAGARALGPLIQGLAKPIHDLSRGCSAEDIVEVATVAIVESEC